MNDDVFDKITEKINIHNLSRLTPELFGEMHGFILTASLIPPSMSSNLMEEAKKITEKMLVVGMGDDQACAKIAQEYGYTMNQVLDYYRNVIFTREKEKIMNAIKLATLDGDKNVQ